MAIYNCRVGSTNGAYNVQDEQVTATSEAEAISILKKKYTYPEATFKCSIANRSFETFPGSLSARTSKEIPNNINDQLVFSEETKDP